MIGKKNSSEANLRTGLLDIDKSIHLFTFQRIGSELSRLPPKPNIPSQGKIISKILKKPDPPSRLLAKAVSNSKFLPPLPENTIKKVVCRETDEYGRSLLQSDCQPSRTKEYKDSDLINRSCSEDITNSQGLNIHSQVSIARNRNIKTKNIITPRGENKEVPPDSAETSTPTFRNGPISGNYMDSCKDGIEYRSNTEEDEETFKFMSYKSSLHQLPISKNFSVKKSKMDSLSNFPCYIGAEYNGNQRQSGNAGNPYQTHKEQRQNCKKYIVREMVKEKSTSRIQNSHQRIKVINRGLPKDVFTINYNHKY